MARYATRATRAVNAVRTFAACSCRGGTSLQCPPFWMLCVQVRLLGVVWVCGRRRRATRREIGRRPVADRRPDKPRAGAHADVLHTHRPRPGLHGGGRTLLSSLQRSYILTLRLLLRGTSRRPVNSSLVRHGAILDSLLVLLLLERDPAVVQVGRRQITFAARP